jgi:uncharacterized phiE125 gp8 family phage protein
MLKLISRSSTAAVSLAEMTAHLKREDTDEDNTLIELYTEAATRWVENFTGLAMVDTTYDYYFDYPDGVDPYGRYVKLPRGPLLEVEAVYYRYGTEGEFTGYNVDYEMPRIFLPYTGSWPTTDGDPNDGRIRFRCGFVDESSPGDSVNEIPADIKAAIQLYTAALYEVRETNTQGFKAPWGAEQLLRMYRIETSLS